MVGGDLTSPWRASQPGKSVGSPASVGLGRGSGIRPRDGDLRDGPGYGFRWLVRVGPPRPRGAERGSGSASRGPPRRTRLRTPWNRGTCQVFPDLAWRPGGELVGKGAHWSALHRALLDMQGYGPPEPRGTRGWRPNRRSQGSSDSGLWSLLPSSPCPENLVILDPKLWPWQSKVFALSPTGLSGS